MSISKRTENKLHSLIKEWLPKKEQADTLGKQVKELSSEIKEILVKENMLEYKFDDQILKIIKVEKVDFDQEALIAVIKKTGVEGIVKTMEYVDMEALESAIYHEKLDATILRPCQIISFNTRLNVTKSKKNKK